MKNTKITLRLVLAALAATAALAGCTKEITPGKADTDPNAPVTEGIRVITVSFAPQTKTTLEGLQPKFDNKDTILLVSLPLDSDVPVKDTCIVSVDDKGIATITTNLTGDLTAIYPAKYAWPTKVGYGAIVPPVQTGKFKDANICSAQIREGRKAVEFKNMATAALFIIEPPTTSVKNLTVKSLKTEEDGGQRTGGRARISFSGDAGDDGNIINVPDGPCDDGKYYVAVYADKIISPGAVNLSDLSFEVEYETSGTGAVKGITTSAIATAAGYSIGDPGYKKFNAVAGGSAYTIDKNNWHDYVEIEGRKWATMNIGADSPTEAGEYFMWGEVTGHKYVNSTWTNFPAEKPADSRYPDTWDSSKGFAWENTPYCCSNDPKFTKYVIAFDAETYGKDGFSDEKRVLDLADDAANFNWGGAWRIPINAEYWEIIPKYDENQDFTDYITLGTNLNFPKTGYASGTGVADGYGIFCWSLLNNSRQPLHFGYDDDDPGLDTEWSDRCIGCTIRAIVDDPDYIATED